MVQRALMKDDSRGVGEPLNEEYDHAAAGWHLPPSHALQSGTGLETCRRDST
jgi:hypothetical protein